MNEHELAALAAVQAAAIAGTVAVSGHAAARMMQRGYDVFRLRAMLSTANACRMERGPNRGNYFHLAHVEGAVTSPTAIVFLPLMLIVTVMWEVR